MFERVFCSPFNFWIKFNRFDNISTLQYEVETHNNYSFRCWDILEQKVEKKIGEEQEKSLNICVGEGNMCRI